MDRGSQGGGVEVLRVALGVTMGVRAARNRQLSVATLLTLPQAILKCTALGYNPLFTRVAWNECIAEHTT